MHVILLSWIYRRFQITLGLLNFHDAPLARKIPWKEVFRLHGFQIGRGCIMMKQMTSRFAMCAWLSILKDGHLNSNTLDKVFIINGFSNWKDASVAFKKHDSPKCHRDSVDKVTTLPKTIKDIGETLSTKHAENKNDNRKCLLKILSSLRCLGRQGLPIRGDGDETDRNYTRLLTLRGEDDSRMLEWLKRKNEKYTCFEVQNEMLQIMALSILGDISQNIRNSVYCSIIAGETTDVSNCEQCVLVLRHVDDDLVAHEDFIGLYKVDSIDSTTLTKTIEDCLLRMNLSLNNFCRGQWYDGASNLSRARMVSRSKSVTKKREQYTHTATNMP